jgi:hypothetical protein
VLSAQQSAFSQWQWAMGSHQHQFDPIPMILHEEYECSPPQFFSIDKVSCGGSDPSCWCVSAPHGLLIGNGNDGVAVAIGNYEC